MATHGLMPLRMFFLHVTETHRFNLPHVAATSWSLSASAFATSYEELTTRNISVAIF